MRVGALLIVAFALIAITFTVVLVPRGGPPMAAQSVAGVGSVAPLFSLADESGEPLALADYRGRVVMLNFWATWCGGCRLELPWLSDLHRRYAADGLVTIGLSLDDDGWTSVRPFLRDHPVAFPMVVADWSLAGRYDALGLPLTLLVDRDGRIAASHLGVIDPDAWEQEIQRVLEPSSALSEHRHRSSILNEEFFRLPRDSGSTSAQVARVGQTDGRRVRPGRW